MARAEQVIFDKVEIRQLEQWAANYGLTAEDERRLAGLRRRIAWLEKQGRAA